MVCCAMNNYMFSFMFTNYFCNPFRTFNPSPILPQYNQKNTYSYGYPFINFNRTSVNSFVLPDLKPNNYTFTYAGYNNSYKYNSGNNASPKNYTGTNRFSSLGYSAEKGERLAREAKNGYVGFTGYCCRYTKRAIERAGLGEAKAGHAYQYDDVLDNNPNFKQISTEGLNLDKDLPAGCVLVYEKGVAGYSSQYGHIEITDGNGNAYSDGKTRNIRPGAKVYIPVESTNYYA